jgi:hypothetical protein
MDEPLYCSICHQRLQPRKHRVAHGGNHSWDAVIRTCPHNLYHLDHYGSPRHDEWHRCESGWVRRDS